MNEITEIEFQRRFDEYQEAARIDPVVITKNEKPYLVLMTYKEYIHLRGEAGIQKAMHVSELSEADIKAISEAKMPAGFEHLNEELED